MNQSKTERFDSAAEGVCLRLRKRLFALPSGDPPARRPPGVRMLPGGNLFSMRQRQGGPVPFGGHDGSLAGRCAGDFSDPVRELRLQP